MRGTSSKSASRSKAAGTKQASRGRASAKPAASSSGLNDLFEAQLKDVYWAEKALTKAMPKMIKKATSEDLIETIEEHLAETQEQIEKLDRVFESLGMKPKGEKCEAMQGLIEEAEELMSDNEEGPVRDAAIIAAAQKVEHYEIASYGTLRTFAEALGHQEAMEILEEILEEEKSADEELTDVAMQVNQEALEEQSEEEDEE